jgi:Tol biopolymer transport system component
MSPNGASVAFTTDSGRVNFREIWMMDSTGANARRLLRAEDDSTGFDWPGWSPDGLRLIYIRYHETDREFETRIESRDLKNDRTSVLYRESAVSYEARELRGYFVLPDGRIIFSLNRSGAGRGAISTLGQKCDLWIAAAGDSEIKASALKRLTDWPAGMLSYFSATTDGKHLAFIRDEGWGSVYVAAVGPDRTAVSPRPMTANAGYNHPEAWMPDSSAVLIGSDRDGRFGIYKQAVDSDAAERIPAGPENAWRPFISADGAWILYVAYSDADGAAQARIMRFPISGGVPQEVLTTSRMVDSPHCARSGLCLIAERSPDDHTIVFTSFDPVNGRGREWSRLAIATSDPDFVWDLSPDGMRIALLKMTERPPSLNTLSEGPIHLLAQSGIQQVLAVKGWTAFGQYIDWSADAKGLFVSSPTETGDALLFVDLQGNARKVWEHGPMKRATRGIPSPNGRYLALLGRNSNMNVWTIEGF